MNNHTDRPLHDKINQVKEYCKIFNEEKTKYSGEVYPIHYYSENGEIKSLSSMAHWGLIVSGVKTREDIINDFIDHFSLYEGNQKDGTTGL